MMLLQWWWREDEMLGTKLDSFVLLFGSPLESRWPGVGSPGCGTVKTFLEEDATVLTMSSMYLVAEIHHVFVVEWSYAWYTRSRLMEWVVIVSAVSDDWSELPLKYLASYDTSCWKWITVSVSCSDSISPWIRRLLVMVMWISVVACVQLLCQSLVDVVRTVQSWHFSVHSLVPGFCCCHGLLMQPCLWRILLMDILQSYYCDHKLSLQGNNQSNAKWWRYLYWNRILYY